MRSDLDIKQDIEELLFWDPRVEMTEIGVVVEEGVVTLTGNVDNLPAKWAAERAALQVDGVKAVANDVEVKIPGESWRSDEDIARAAAHALEWNVQLPKNLQVTVDDGWVTLIGHVEWQYQKVAAESAIDQLTGVKGIFNNITVSSQVEPSEVKKKIEFALARHGSVDVNSIQVKTDGSTVTLEGTVHSSAEKNAVEDAARSAPGVGNVENNLMIV